MNKSWRTKWTTFMFGFTYWYFLSTGTTIKELVLRIYYHGKMVVFIFEKTILVISKKVIPCVNFYLKLLFFMIFWLLNTSLTIKVLFQSFQSIQCFWPVVGWWHEGFLGCKTFWICTDRDIGCLGYRMFKIWDVWDVIC